MELEVRNIPEAGGEAVVAACAWGLQTLLHALSVAARETGVCLADHEGDLSAVERTKARVETILDETFVECGSAAPIERVIYVFVRRVFNEANGYLDRMHDLFPD